MAEKAGEKKEGFYKKYMRIMGKVGDIQGRGILIILYFTVFLIPGIFVSIFGDRLQIKRKPNTWQDRTDHEYTLERAKEQW